MDNKIKTITSRGTIYHKDFPLLPRLYRYSKPATWLAVALSSVLVYVLVNGIMDASNLITTSLIYLCLYFFVAGSLIGLTVGRPPRKIYSLTIKIILSLATFFFMVVQSTIWFQSPDSEAGAYYGNYPNPVFMLMITIYIVMKIPLIATRYRRGIQQMQREIQDSFHT